MKRILVLILLLEYCCVHSQQKPEDVRSNGSIAPVTTSAKNKEVFYLQIEILTAKLNLDPTNSKYLSNRAMLFFATNQYEKALKDYDAALGLKPANTAELFFYRGMTKLTSGKYFPISGCDDLRDSKKLGFQKEDWETISMMCGTL